MTQCDLNDSPFCRQKVTKEAFLNVLQMLIANIWSKVDSTYCMKKLGFIFLLPRIHPRHPCCNIPLRAN